MNSKVKKKSRGDKASEVLQKKPFDKKKWRERKYSKKWQVQQWEERKRQAVLRKYHKVLKKEKIMRPDPEEEQLPEKKNKLNSFKAAQLKLNKKKEEQEKKKIELLRKKEEFQKAMENYKKAKTEKFKKLSTKTKKGQPLMRDRISLLYEKIKSQVGNNV